MKYAHVTVKFPAEAVLQYGGHHYNAVITYEQFWELALRIPTLVLDAARNYGGAKPVSVEITF